jgi:putative membrane protein
MRWLLIAVAALHVMFMVLEMFPWGSPVLLRIVSRKLPKGEPFTDDQRKLVATIVHNAGIYNAILAGGLLWAAWPDAVNRDVARVLLAGVAVAGVFGTATLKSPFTALQAVLGIVGLIGL